VLNALRGWRTGSHRPADARQGGTPAPSLRRLMLSSSGMRRIATLPGLLPEWTLVSSLDHPESGDAIAAWGLRPSAIQAQTQAHARGLPVLHLEDGLLRSVGLGSSGPPLSLMVDDLGLYLDASRPTRLEAAIGRARSVEQCARADALIALWREERVSKYNHQRDTVVLPDRPYVLVIDQTRGDASIHAGLASAESFQHMLAAALHDYPGHDVVLKVHPDVVSGRRQGHFDLRALRTTPRVQVCAEDVHPVSLIEHADAVFVVTSQVGFEAVMWGKPVHVFGMPFYAGWGQTADRMPPPERRHGVSLAQLVYGTLIDYARYVDPESGVPGEPEQLVRWMGLQRRMRARFAPMVQAYGFSKWKRPFVQDFFQGSAVHFVKRVPPQSDAPVALWGRKHDALFVKKRGALPARRIRLEDGFLRSVGLGADLVRPLSWVQDDVGIYYDATEPSGLEGLLGHHVFDPALVARAAALRQRILQARLTKYNVGSDQGWSRPAHAQRVILVPGQVESDASIRFGAHTLRRNIDLLQAVRRAHPDAYVVYKAHPDVQARLRDSGQGEGEAPAWCDEVVENVGMQSLLDKIDEVHTLTSLTGFEALLRHKHVVTYGQPFYAGWGLTDDQALTPAVRARRQRRVTLDELVAATLILYPTYVSRRTRMFTTPENALQELISWRDETPHMPWLRRWFAYLTRKL